MRILIPIICSILFTIFITLVSYAAGILSPIIGGILLSQVIINLIKERHDNL